MAKNIEYDIKARKALEAGIDKVADTIKATLGPKGRNILIEKKFFAPTVTNDGATIAKSIDLEDPFENMGAQLIKEAAAKTNDVAGDGTTTATVLAQSMVKEGLKNLAAGANPVLLNKGIHIAVEKAMEEIKKIAHKDLTAQDITRIATISCKDEKIGALLGEAFEKLGTDAAVVVESSETMETYLEIKEGFVCDRGYVSDQMINVPEKGQVVLEKPLVLLTDKKFHKIDDIFPILAYISKVNRPLVLFVDELEDEALQLVNVNIQKGIISMVAIQGPTHGENRWEKYHDYRALIGGDSLTDQFDIAADQITPEMYGEVDKVIVGKREATFLGGKRNENLIKQRVEKIHGEMEQYPSDFTNQICSERLRVLAGGAAIVHVSAMTEPDLNDKKLRVEDAINATKAAALEGIVAGGGTTYIDILPALEQLRDEREDVQIGINLVKRSLIYPLYYIAQNGGAEGYVVANKVKELPIGWGYNALTEKYVDMFAAGIIDPAKVSRSALQNAGSIAQMVLTTESMIAEKIKAKEEAEEKEKEKKKNKK